MQRVASMKTFIVILIIFYLSSLFSENILVSYTNALSESPSFVRQEIIDEAGDWKTLEDTHEEFNYTYA